MDLFLLPGNHEGNAQWSQDVAAALGDKFNVHIQSYRHWSNGQPLINFDLELNRFVESTRDIGEYVMLGKSIGAILAIKGIHEGRIRPQKCVFVGMPIRRARHEFDLDQWLGRYRTPTLFIQQTNDIAAPYAELEKFLKETMSGNYRLIEVPGDDHVYGNIELLKSHILNFFGI